MAVFGPKVTKNRPKTPGEIPQAPEKGGFCAVERDIVAAILRFLKNEASCFAWKTHGNQYQAGIPDIIACVHGRFVAFEVKRPGGRPTKLQEAALRRIGAAGGVAAVVHSVDEAREALKSLTAGN
jgi:hypothetical protein